MAAEHLFPSRFHVITFGLLGLSAVLRAAVPSCATCHPKEDASHAGTRMAHAMVPARGSGFAENLPDHVLSEPQGGYQFAYTQTNGGLLMTASKGLETSEGLIQWVLGAGAQGQTPLVREGSTVRESRVSYFPQLHQYGITVGQTQPLRPIRKRPLA